MLHLDGLEGESLEQPSETSSLCAISHQAVNGTKSPKTIRLQGWVKNKHVLMLVESGSTHTFISHKIAALFNNAKPLPSVVKVSIADVESYPAHISYHNVSGGCRGTVVNRHAHSSFRHL